MLIWLAEALNLDKARLDATFDAVTAKETMDTSQCAALRTQIGQDSNEAGIGQFQYSLIQTLRIRLANH
jgi:hypothetical protein